LPSWNFSRYALAGNYFLIPEQSVREPGVAIGKKRAYKRDQGGFFGGYQGTGRSGERERRSGEKVVFEKKGTISFKNGRRSRGSLQESKRRAGGGLVGLKSAPRA